MLPQPSRNLSPEAKGLWWTDPPEESLPFEFCRDTSLHGLKYIEQPRRHLTERIFWFVAFVTGLIVAVVLITELWRNFRDNPIIVTFAPFETTLDDIPFPAVTICNMNKVQGSNALEIIKRLEAAEAASASDEDLRKAYEDVYLLQHICSGSSGFSRVFNFSLHKGSVDAELLERNDHLMNKSASLNIEAFLQSASQSCSQMIALCIWQHKVRDCRDLFNPIETKFGKCCTFNMVPQTLFHKFRDDSRDNKKEVADWMKWNVEEDGFIFSGNKNSRRRFPRRQRQAGKTYGLSVLLDPDLQEYFCTSSDAVGFRMATHVSTDIPEVGDFGLSIEPNKEVFVNVKADITIAEESIHGFSLDKRLCYFPLDYPLKYYRYYTPANCVKEAIADATLHECKCVRYYMPRDNNTNLCGSDDLQCTADVKRNYSMGLLNTSSPACYPLCTEIQYSTTTTATNIQNANDNWMFQNHSSARWQNSSVSILHVYFGQRSTNARIRKQFLTSLDLIAQTGGIMGLCLGFSGLSLVEFIYYFTVRPWWQTRWKQNFGARVFQTVAGAWQKTKKIAHIHGQHGTMAVPNVHEITKAHSIGRHKHGIWSQHDMMQQINAMITSKSKHVNHNHPDDQEISSRGDGTSGGVLSSEIAPYYRRSAARTQYWNMNTIMEH